MVLHKDFPQSPHVILDPGRHKLAVKVVDIFGNDTMKIIEVSVGNNGGRK